MNSDDLTQIASKSPSGRSSLEILDPPRVIHPCEGPPLPALEGNLRGMMREVGELRFSLKQSERTHLDTLRSLFSKILDAIEVLDCQTRCERGSKPEAPSPRLAALHSAKTLLEQALEAQGLFRTTPKPGERFDPHQHRVLDTVQCSDRATGEIVEVNLPGWRWRDDWLRKAAVVVAQCDSEPASDQ